MNMFKKITTGTLALTLAVGMAGGALAATENDSDVTVNIFSHGVLAVHIDGNDFEGYPYQLEDQDTEPIDIVIYASDERGTAAGWHVTLSGEDFVDEDKLPKEFFAIENLSVAHGDVETTSSTGQPSEDPPAAYNLLAVETDPQTVLTADPGSGAGKYTNTRGATLTIPAGTLVGDYKATLTVTIIGEDAAPGPGDEDDS